jgi:hypothetical protein
LRGDVGNLVIVLLHIPVLQWGFLAT